MGGGGSVLGPRDERPGIARDGDGWVRETKLVAGVPVVVSLDDDAVREEIMGSVRPIGAEDVYGCPATHRNATRPLARPAPGAGLGSIGSVESVAICTYVLRELVRDSEVRLFAGSRAHRARARTAVAAIRAAPKGSGPNDPADCPRGEVNGDELTVLLVRGSCAEAEVVMRYSGCDHHGIDDGEVERQFTEPVMDILRVGPHRPEALNGSMASLLFGAEPSK